MLILTRKLEESLIINGNIEVKIVAIEDNKIKIGIDAPREVEIYRKEVYDKIQEENKLATKSNVDMEALKKLL